MCGISVYLAMSVQGSLCLLAVLLTGELFLCIQLSTCINKYSD